MNYCKKCKTPLQPEAKFCIQCGAKTKFEDVGQSIAKSNKGLTTGIACGISAVVLAAFFVFVFAFGDGALFEKKKFSKSASTEEKIEGNIAFTADSYQVETNQDMDMSAYLQCEGISLEDVSWSSDSEEMIVGSKGHIVVNDYGIDCTLTATSKQDESIKSVCNISTRSQQDDLIYEVEALNGAHGQDEVNEEGVVVTAYSSEMNQMIDTDKKTRKPKKRNNTYVWNKNLFYTLEDISQTSNQDGKINSYHVEKKMFINQDTGNEMEYEIYINPDRDVINKIVSIEHLNKRLEITEYYYTDKGKVNFVYRYKDVNYTPSYATPNRDGERYLFHKDTMTTWRIVKKRNEKNYCCGAAENRRVSVGRTGVKTYWKCSEKIQKQFEEKELLILNQAYNTLEKVMNYDGVSTISGYLDEADGEGIKDASVRLDSTDYACTAYVAKTNKDGYYEILVPTRAQGYELIFEKENYLSETVYQVDVSTDKINVNQEVVYLSEEDENEYECELYFYDALNIASDGSGMAPLEGMDVYIRRGVNNKEGETVYEGYVSGYSETVSLAPGMYTVQMSGNGYIDAYSSLFVSRDTGNELSIYATPKLDPDEIRVVLTWGSTPNDLDSHMFAPGNGYSADDYHICYYHKSDYNQNTMLDVDDTDGYGPETTTIRHVQRGQYKYYVCDYTNCSAGNEESYGMSDSSATVRVYGSSGLIQSFYVPVNRKGVIWEVFEIRDGKVIPTQRYYDSIGNKTWWRQDKW